MRLLYFYVVICSIAFVNTTRPDNFTITAEITVKMYKKSQNV